MKILLIITCLILSGCRSGVQQSWDNARNDSKAKVGRFEVTFVGKFSDYSSYYNYRGIYLFKDTETGKEYFGVAGIGISEMQMAHCGKTNHPIED